mmetsp:Transcript_2505/g.3831  ORF Transcript_2505/g.3831 Transcript_2505/m.3831 type:complete len:292 (-) Transcript_2505:708-1583(-)
MISASAIFLQYVSPSMGCIMANLMLTAPVSSLREAISRGSLGDLNPTPWAFMTGNCVGWVSYAILKQNLFILFSNAPGLILSFWMNVGAAKLQYKEMCMAHHNDVDRNNSKNDSSTNDGGEEAFEDKVVEKIYVNISYVYSLLTSQERWFLGVIIAWIITLSCVCFTPMPAIRRAEIIGLASNINLIVFYGAPLSTILEVLRTRNSSSIHRRTLVMSLLNAFFWTAYGFAIVDIMVIFPNATGLLLGIFQVCLCVVFSSNMKVDNRKGHQLVQNEDGDGKFSIHDGDIEII